MKRKRKHKHKHHDSALEPYQQQRKAMRNLGYKNTEEYQRGLSTVKRLLADKEKNFPQPVEIPVENK